MTKCDSPSILQCDRAPGHIDPVFNKLVGESGRFLLWTPAGGSGFVQACDDIINAMIQKSLTEVSTEWLIEKVMALQEKGDCGAVANPSLIEMCQMLAKALKQLTPAAQRRSFEHCLLTLPTDGSEDEKKGSKALMALMKEHGECLVPNVGNSDELFPVPAKSSVKEGHLTSILNSLISYSAALPRSLFHHIPSSMALPPKALKPSKPIGKKSSGR